MDTHTLVLLHNTFPNLFLYYSFKNEKLKNWSTESEQFQSIRAPATVFEIIRRLLVQSNEMKRCKRFPPKFQLQISM